MTAADTVELGFEIGSGARVEIPIRHMVVTGQTQEAGKTTTLEALIARAQRPALAFVTKRGEKSFADGRRIPPYFRERADWQFVQSVLEATMRERMKFERGWIMRVTKHAKTLADVLKNCKELKKLARSGIDESMYMQLEAYLEIIVPRVARIQWAKTVNLKPGINVVDLADRDDFPPELQSLVMDAVIRWVYESAHGVITIIPEAWEFVPQARGSPVKLAAVELIRKGAGLRNYVWLDSQDIGGVDKEILRSCPVWLLGVQRETNEIKRVLDNIPAGTKKPKPAEVALLKRGEFFACFGEHVIRTYVRPAWMDEESAIDVARGDATLLPPRPAPAPRPVDEEAAPPDALVEHYSTIAEELRAEHAEAMRKLGEEHGRALVTAEERGRLAGFDQGYAAATSTVTASLQGVIRHAQEFVDELREISRTLAKNGGPGVQAIVNTTPREIPSGPTIARETKIDVREAGIEPLQAEKLKALRALAAKHPIELTRAEIATNAGMAKRGGAFLKQMKDLQSAGLVQLNGKHYSLTARGVAVAGDAIAAAPANKTDLIELWAKKLPGSKGGEALRILVACHPESMQTKQLAVALGMAGRGGAFLELMRYMRRAGLVEDHGKGVRASAVLVA